MVFTEHTEDHCVLAWVVAGTDCVITDLIARSLPRSPLPTVLMLREPHFIGDDLSESKRSSAGRILFESVMALDDFNVGVGGLEGLPGESSQLHRKVDRHTHAWCPDDGYAVARTVQKLLLLITQPSSGHDKWNRPFMADLRCSLCAGWHRKVDHHVNVCLQAIGNKYTVRINACCRARVVP